MWRIALSSVQLAATVLYLGGAVTMELVLRYAQRELPGPQTAVTCQVSGRRWRWWAQGSLAAAGLAFLGSSRSEPAPVALTVAYWAVWALLAGLLVVMSYRAHPALARKLDPGADPEQRRRSREELKKAIVRMDRLLRAELVLAFLLAFVSALYFEEVVARSR